MLWRLDIDALVAGAGPVGLFVALSLAHRGHRVGVVDEAPPSPDRTHALLLHPRTLERFEALGLPVPESPRLGSIAVYTATAESRVPVRKAEIPLAAHSTRFPFLATVGYDALVASLEEKLVERGGGVLRHHRFLTFEQAENAVHIPIQRLAQVAVGYGGAREEWRVERELSANVPFFLAANGHRSSARTGLGLSFPSFAPTQRFAVFEFRSDSAPIEELRILYTNGLESSLWPLGGNRWRLTAELDATHESPPMRPGVTVAGGESFHRLDRRALETMLPERAPWLDGRVGQVDWATVVRFERRLATGFGRGRVFLLGDAAHLFPPTLCWSLNLGLQEGADLAERLDAVIRRRAPLVALDEYNRRWSAAASRFTQPPAEAETETSLTLLEAVE